MRNRFVVGLLLALVLGAPLAGCSRRQANGGGAPAQPAAKTPGDTHESLTQEQLAFAKEWDDILDTVTDEASMRAAGPKIKALVHRAEQFEARRRALPARSYADAEAMRKKNERALTEMNERHERHHKRIWQLPGGKEFWWASEKSVGGHLTDY